jgi:glycosyltransferase involved in cell wall biosynthesis
MRIVHYVDSTSLQDGGVPRFVLDVAGVMAERGHSITLLTTETTDTPAAWLQPHDGTAMPKVQVIERSGVQKTLITKQAVADARKMFENQDVLHLHCVWSMANAQLAQAAQQMGLPYVVSTHGMLDIWSMQQNAIAKRAYLALRGTKMLEASAYVHSAARAEAEQTLRWFPKGKQFTVPYIVDLSPYWKLPGPELARKEFAALGDSATPTLLFLSRLHYKKGVEHLLRASKLLVERGVAHQVALAGPGDDRYVQSLKDLAKELGIASHVHFVGMVRGELRTSLYQAADLFVLPTSQENFGIVLLESLCCETPVLTTKGVDIWRELLESNAATIVETKGIVEQLAARMQVLLRDRVALKDAGRKARDWGLATYSREALVPQFERMYGEAAATRATSAAGANVR